MQFNILKMILLVCIATAAITSCSFAPEQEASPLEKAKANVKKATQELDMARLDSAEYANYKIESEKKLRGNELLIADMKDRMKSERKESRIKFEKQLDSLGMQNTRLRNNIQIYNSEGKAKWESFKLSFNKELDALGKAISKIAEKNMNKG